MCSCAPFGDAEQQAGEMREGRTLNRIGSGRTAGREAVRRGLAGGRFGRPANQDIVYL